MFKFIVAGGGSASVSIVNNLIRSGRVQPSQILVIEPSLVNYYQPGFTMIGGRVLGDAESIKKNSMHIIENKTANMFPFSVPILQKEVVSFNPEQNSLLVSGGESLKYENLIVSMGIHLDFEAVPGLKQALDDEKSTVGSIYRLPYAFKTNKIIENFKGGNAIFCIPPLPIKCPGAPQKIMHLAIDNFKAAGVTDFKVHYFMAQPAIFSVPKYAKKLKEIAEGKGINLHFEHTISRVEHEKKLAYFKNKDGEIAVPYDMLHVPPPQRGVNALKNSTLVDKTGFVEVNKETLRHTRYNNVWALGDCANTPIPKTLAGALSQSQVLTHNLFQVLDKKDTNAKYEGYTACPIFVGNNKLMMCEFKYGLVPHESFSYKQDIPNGFYYWAKKWLFPRVYMKLVKKNWWFGRTMFFKPKF